jgi:hypothetical protein
MVELFSTLVMLCAYCYIIMSLIYLPTTKAIVSDNYKEPDV